MEIQQKLGNRIVLLREQIGMTQKDLAYSSDLDRSYIAGIEKGHRNVSIKNIEKIAQALGHSVRSFFDHETFE